VLLHEPSLADQLALQRSAVGSRYCCSCTAAAAIAAAVIVAIAAAGFGVVAAAGAAAVAAANMELKSAALHHHLECKQQIQTCMHRREGK
jgi:hypothetical protein